MAINMVEVSPEELASMVKTKGATERQAEYDTLIANLAASGKGARLSEAGIAPRGVALSLHHAAKRANITGLHTQVLTDGCYAYVRPETAPAGDGAPVASRGKGGK